ncbi:hypothetical protein [Thioclava sp. GXIMD4216]|uniref:hypothetical protein n=1 Tax=Thioclava sp. GXIMD4216 TaxID=3131929 RepID=UPI0030D08EF5
MMRPKAGWATIILIIVTCLTIGVMVGLVIRDWDRFIVMPLNEIGDFLAGTAGTVALIWIVYGYLQQNKALEIQQAELKNSVEALNLQTEELRNSVEQQRLSAEHLGTQAKTMEEQARNTRLQLAEERKQIIVETYPLLTARKAHSRVVDGKLHQNLEFQNIAADCTAGELTISSKTAVSTEKKFNLLRRYEVLDYMLIVESTKEAQTDITITSMSNRNKKRQQTFRWSKGSITEIKCVPPKD